jgi:hypothetical protein
MKIGSGLPERLDPHVIGEHGIESASQLLDDPAPRGFEGHFLTGGMNA